MHYFYHFVEKNEKNKKQKSGIYIVQFYIILSSQEK